eukprot:COSAG01_NODE_23988_length_794_cov_5.706475_2_plen_82_part_00
MTVLSKFANAYDPLLFWKRLPDELLHEIANPLVRVKERHRRVMRELMFGPACISSDSRLSSESSPVNTAFQCFTVYCMHVI